MERIQNNSPEMRLNKENSKKQDFISSFIQKGIVTISAMTLPTLVYLFMHTDNLITQRLLIALTIVLCVLFIKKIQTING
ncbi:hypothetical protein [Ascidiimonas sp. W6]|uniref:hypothetical protein n=1 Tax=Ascidiimonas meishanensis TaxID=3128903 RepID=UPI0030EE8525